MATTLSKPEIISLIMADMRNRKLMLGMEQLGLAVENYYTNLYSIILTQLGYDISNEKIIDFYESILENLHHIEISTFHAKQQQLAENLYDALVGMKLFEVDNYKQSHVM